MGNTCISMADSFWYMAKPIQYCKVKKNFFLRRKEEKKISKGIDIKKKRQMAKK